MFQSLLHKITMEFWLEWDILSTYLISMIGKSVPRLQQHNSLMRWITFPCLARCSGRANLQ